MRKPSSGMCMGCPDYGSKVIAGGKHRVICNRTGIPPGRMQVCPKEEMAHV